MRPIDADELKKLRDKYIRGEIKFDDEYDLIDKCPTIDAVPVVRCKDCKYHDEGEYYIYCWVLKTKCPDDSEFFCKYGELEG